MGNTRTSVDYIFKLPSTVSNGCVWVCGPVCVCLCVWVCITVLFLFMCLNKCVCLRQCRLCCSSKAPTTDAQKNPKTKQNVMVSLATISYFSAQQMLIEQLVADCLGFQRGGARAEENPNIDGSPLQPVCLRPGPLVCFGQCSWEAMSDYHTTTSCENKSIYSDQQAD